MDAFFGIMPRGLRYLIFWMEVCKTGEGCHHEEYDASHPPKGRPVEQSRSPEMSHPIDGK